MLAGKRMANGRETMNIGTIKCQTTLEMVTVVCGLVREGVTFKCYAEAITGIWTITLTGGY